MKFEKELFNKIIEKCEFEMQEIDKQTEILREELKEFDEYINEFWCRKPSADCISINVHGGVFTYL